MEDVARASAPQLVEAIGSIGVADLGPWHHELARAVQELHDSVGSALSWSVADPVVALVRALARLARRSPEATSPAAAALVAMLGPR